MKKLVFMFVAFAAISFASTSCQNKPAAAPADSTEVADSAADSLNADSANADSANAATPDSANAAATDSASQAK